jgi:hypothetical protein
MQPALVSLPVLTATGRAPEMNQQLDFRSVPHDTVFLISDIVKEDISFVYDKIRSR